MLQLGYFFARPPLQRRAARLRRRVADGFWLNQRGERCWDSPVLTHFRITELLLQQTIKLRMFPFFHKQDDVFVVFVTGLPGYSGGANLRPLCANPRHSNPLLVSQQLGWRFNPATEPVGSQALPLNPLGGKEQEAKDRLQGWLGYLLQATLNPRGVYSRKVRGSTSSMKMERPCVRPWCSCSWDKKKLHRFCRQKDATNSAFGSSEGYAQTSFAHGRRRP